MKLPKVESQRSTTAHSKEWIPAIRETRLSRLVNKVVQKWTLLFLSIDKLVIEIKEVFIYKYS